MRAEYFQKGMADLRDAYGQSSYPPIKEHIIHTLVGHLPDDGWEQIVYGFIASERLAPTPSDLARAAEAWSVKNTPKPSPTPYVTCQACLNTGWLFFTSQKYGDGMLHCSCEAGLSIHKDSGAIPMWNEEKHRAAGLLPLPFPVHLFKDVSPAGVVIWWRQETEKARTKWTELRRSMAK